MNDNQQSQTADAAGMSAHRHYHLLQLRGAIWLHARGMRHSSGRSVLKYTRNLLGKPSNTPWYVLLEAVEDELLSAGTPRKYTPVCLDPELKPHRLGTHTADCHTCAVECGP